MIVTGGLGVNAGALVLRGLGVSPSAVQDTHDGDDRFIADYVRRRRKRRKLKEQEALAERQEAVAEAYAALQDIPAVRQEIRQAMRVDRTPELAQILADYRAMAVLLKRYEAILEDDDEVVMLLGGF